MTRGALGARRRVLQLHCPSEASQAGVSPGSDWRWGQFLEYLEQDLVGQPLKGRRDVKHFQGIGEIV